MHVWVDPQDDCVTGTAAAGSINATTSTVTEMMDPMISFRLRGMLSPNIERSGEVATENIPFY